MGIGSLKPKGSAETTSTTVQTAKKNTYSINNKMMTAIALSAIGVLLIALGAAGLFAAGSFALGAALFIGGIAYLAVSMYKQKKALEEAEKLNKAGQSVMIKRFHEVVGKNPELAKALLAKGVKCDSENAEGYSPLQNAARKGDVAGIKFLLDHKANLEQSTEKAASPLFVAIEASQPAAVKALLDAGAKTTCGTATALVVAQGIQANLDPKKPAKDDVKGGSGGSGAVEGKSEGKESKAADGTSAAVEGKSEGKETKAAAGASASGKSDKAKAVLAQEKYERATAVVKILEAVEKKAAAQVKVKSSSSEPSSSEGAAAALSSSSAAASAAASSASTSA